MAGRIEIPDDLIVAALNVLDGEEGVEFRVENAVPVAAAMAALWTAVCDEYELKLKHYYPFGKLNPDDPLDQAFVNAFNKGAKRG